MEAIEPGEVFYEGPGVVSRVREFFRWRKAWGTSWYGITGESVEWVIDVLMQEAFIPHLVEMVNTESAYLTELRRYE